MPPGICSTDQGGGKRRWPSSGSALSNINPFNKRDGGRPRCVTVAIGLSRLRLLSRLKRRLLFIVSIRHVRRHVSVHNFRNRSGAEVDRYEQRFCMIECVQNGGNRDGIGLI